MLDHFLHEALVDFVHTLQIFLEVEYLRGALLRRTVAEALLVHAHVIILPLDCTHV